MPIVDPADPGVWANAYQIGLPQNRRVRLGYHRATMMGVARAHAKGLQKALNLTLNSRIVLVGAGFGWTVEAVKETWPTAKIAAVDISAWVHTEKDKRETADYRVALQAAGLDPDGGPGANLLADMDDGGPRARVTILNEDLASTQSRQRVKQWLSENAVDWAITEEVLPWLDDAECQALSNRMHGLATNVAHLLTPYLPNKRQAEEPPPIWNWKYPSAPNGGVVQQLWDQPWYTVDNWTALLPSDTIVSVGSFEVF